MKRSNIMYVNDKEVEYSDNEMREFFEDFLEGQTKAYFNLKKSYRELFREKKDLENKIEKLQKELDSLNK